MADVAVLGTGRMGAAMVGRLRAAGHRVTVYNRTADRAREVAARTGATSVDSPAQAVARAEIVLSSLADDTAVLETYAALAAGLRAGMVVLEASTIAPHTVRTAAGMVRERGATMLDAPVSGSVSSVERGELTVMVGGDPAALDRARPVLAAFAARVVHLGPLGNGAVMKLAVNDVVHALNQALAEALVLAEKAGVAREAAYDIFANSAVAAPFVQYKREAFVHPDQVPVAFALELVAKDLDLIADLAGEVGARMEQLAANRRVVALALEHGYGGRDLSALAELLRGKLSTVDSPVAPQPGG